MRNFYKKLYNDCLQSNTFKNDAHFVSMRGAFYDKNETKFLLVGIATNGWGSLKTDTADAFALDAQRQFDDCQRFNWIETVDKTLYARDSKYCIDTKPFWCYTKTIWQKLSGTVSYSNIWTENIAWSNLYKVSPLLSGNPNDESMKIQQSACIEILKKELEVYKPTHILFLTGYDWFTPFSSIFDVAKDFGVRNVMRGPKKNKNYVEGIASYQNAKAVIACRPEFRNKEEIVKDVFRAFSEKL